MWYKKNFIQTMIRVGTITNKNKKRIIPRLEGYNTIVCLGSSSAWGDLSPFVLRDSENRIMENIWQFSKVYERVPKTVVRYPYKYGNIVWDRGEETHIVHENGSYVLTDDYWKWREDGMNTPSPIRRPVPKRHMRNCVFALSEDNPGQPLTYLEARREMYIPLYCDLVREEPKYEQLYYMVKNGVNLLIVEVDGPKDLPYYMEKYGVDSSFIVDNTIEVNEVNINIMLNDEKYPFGHGYCLALCLLDMEDQINQPIVEYKYPDITSCVLDRHRTNLTSSGYWDSLTVKELKEEIKKLRNQGFNILLGGKKQNLVNRIVLHYSSA